MLLIPCPYCGLRPETEFGYGGEAHLARPVNSADMSDAEWAAYVYWRKNTKGVFHERWVHQHGCRRWFNVIRDTTTYEILAVYGQGAEPPKVEVKTYV
ncbi:MAG: sarcosine oxidase subunit delta [Pseudomonadota bacterium]